MNISHILRRFFLAALFALSIIFTGCRHHSAPYQIKATENDNEKYGQIARCNSIYHNVDIQSHYDCSKIEYPHCNPQNTLSYAEKCKRSLYAPSMYEVTVSVFREILQKRSRNAIGEQIAKNARTMLRNMMRNPDRPIHPVAFFATIKDFETGVNLFEWGAMNFACTTPNLCQNKCISKKDCERWCTRHGSPILQKENCISQCQQNGYMCDNHCLGLFQVDAELENFFQTANMIEPQLHKEELVRWDFQEVCGHEGLNLIGITGGPDYCALLFWLLSNNAYKCTAFAHEYDFHGANPCTNPNYSWNMQNISMGARAYQQQQKDSAIWKKRYQGFFNHQGEAILGFEHCAAHGFHHYDYQQAIKQNNPNIPKKSLESSVIQFGCDVNFFPDWASYDHCNHHIN